jgi:excinuclease UvrABC nuclease subunit
MLTQVSDIAVTETPSALEAALLENETIKALNPPYNVQLTTGDRRVWYSSAAFEAAATPSDEHVIGPLPSEYSLRESREDKAQNPFATNGRYRTCSVH